MNTPRILLSSLLLAALAMSCTKNEVPLPQAPQVDMSKQYVAQRLHTEAIHIGIRGKWLMWSQDSVLIKDYISRNITEENNPGFLPVKKSLPVSQTHQLSFANQLARLVEGGQVTEYTYQLPGNYNILWLQQTDTVTYYENEKPAVVSKLGYFPPAYYQRSLANDNPDFRYKIKTVPERYFGIETGKLHAPGLLYHIQKWDEVEDHGQIHNYLGYQPDILQALEVGDTLLIQLYSHEFAY